MTTLSTTTSPIGRSTRRFQALLPLLLVLALLGAFVRPAAAAPDESRVLPQLQREAAEQPNSSFRVIVTRLDNNPAADRAAGAGGGKKLKDLPHNAFVAEMPGRAIEALGRNPAVKYVAPDARMNKTGIVDSSKLGTLYPQVVKATGLWSGTNPVTGSGIGVAVVDTGITAKGDFTFPTGGSRIVAKVLFNANLEKTGDGHGHGTHVAGIVAGNSWAQSDLTLRGKYIGIAPEANLINVRVSDETGMSYLSDVVTAIDWVVANRVTYNIRVMNLSLVSSVAESAKTSILAAAVERAWFNGIFVVVAAGNAGPDTLYYPPANDPFVVTVGAADSMGTVAQGDDMIAPWSSYGVTQDGYSKPDVVAPGRYIVSPLASSGSTLGTQFPERIVDGKYVWLSGTSMAAPVVAGVAALAFQAHPEWTNDQVKWLLLNTSQQLGIGGILLPGQGAGEVDATAVVRYSSTPGFANQGLPINQNLVTTDGSTSYSSASWSTASWSTASWSTASWSTASWSTASWSTASWSTASWSSADETDVR
ncbi:MAG: hypothetical protein CYG59_13660 [Chloroflexi bacterium]|nr:MAG: hypothetical protein CYG59_13660 [Chloroflexota bacterium]